MPTGCSLTWHTTGHADGYGVVIALTDNECAIRATSSGGYPESGRGQTKRGASKESLDEEGIRRSGGRLARTCREWIDRERESVADGRPRAFAALTGPDTDRPGSYFLVYRWRSVRASGLSSVSFLTRDHSDLPVPVSGNRHINETVTFLQRSILFESASHFKTNFRFRCRPRTTTGAVRA